MANRDKATNEFEHAVAEKVAAPSTKHAEHKRDQMLASKQLADGRAIYKAKRQEIHRKIIVGGAVLAEAMTNPEFRTQLYEILTRRLIDPRDRNYIAGGDNKETELIGTMAPTNVAPPSAAEFRAMAEQRLGKANSSDT
ncbi:MAG TPA: hypothetical protein VGM26_03070 [Rhizomicrobium sp.]|jgi:Fic family protein